MYKGLSDIGASHLLSKSDLPCSIGLSNTCIKTLKHLGYSKNDLSVPVATHQTVLLGHLQGFGLEQVEVPGDGNCFFTAVAFSVLNLLSASINERAIRSLADIGITPDMSVESLSNMLRNLVVEEW